MEGFNDFAKAGFARLLKHFETNTNDVVMLTKAFALANKAHKDKLLDEPHINHSLRVALILEEELQVRDAELLSAAILHDALESMPEGSIAQECGQRVASIVRSTTEKSGVIGSDEYYARLAKEPKEARLIKLAEKLDIARAMKNHAYRDRALRFKEETQKHVIPLAQNTDERFAFKLSVALYEIK